jgi:putative DNA primase/helicase
MMSVAETARALGLKRAGREYVGECPSCNYKSGFAVGERDGRLVLYCAAGGCDQRELWAALHKHGFGNNRDAEHQAKPARDGDKKKAIAQRLWDQSSTETRRGLVGNYLLSRGIQLPIPPALRYLSLCPHPNKERRLPAMVAKVVNVDCELVSVHRTFLRDDGLGKAEVVPQKATLGPFHSGAIRLGVLRPDSWLIIGEGVENTLSAMQIYNCPGWSAISAGGLHALILPPEARMILLCADRDANGIGEKKAREAAIRWVREGRRVRLVLPPQGFNDFNDALIGNYYDR